MYNSIFQDLNESENNIFFINKKKTHFIQKEPYIFLNNILDIDSLVFKSLTDEAKLRIRRNLKYKIKLILPSQEAKMGAPLSPILSQYGINVKDFTDFFNENTKFMEAGYSLPIFIYLYKDKNIDIIFNKLSIFKYIIDYLNSKRVKFINSITRLDFYKLYLLYALYADNFILEKFLNNIFSTFESWNFFFVIKKYQEKEKINDNDYIF
jgi:hypothetical protein